jgi:hypothetical protein
MIYICLIYLLEHKIIILRRRQIAIGRLGIYVGAFVFDIYIKSITELIGR